jgi:membrane associated rhomboid family serine protease
MRGFWQDIQRILQQPEQGLLKIIVLNSSIFVLLMLFRLISILSGNAQVYENLIESLTLSSSLSTTLQAPWTLISYFFVHVEIFHLAFNMMFLYWFGLILQEVLGSQRSVRLYFVGGIVGALAFLIAYNSIGYYQSQGISFLLGASGGVFAIVVAAATLRPNYEVHLFLIGPVRIKFIAGFYMLWSILETVGANAGGNIAHLGGALSGFCIAYLFEHPIQISWLKKKEKIFIDASLTRESSRRKQAENIEEEEINQILDKISKSGYDSLSKTEKRRLFKASQKNE